MANLEQTASEQFLNFLDIFMKLITRIITEKGYIADAKILSETRSDK